MRVCVTLWEQNLTFDTQTDDFESEETKKKQKKTTRKHIVLETRKSIIFIIQNLLANPNEIGKKFPLHLYCPYISVHLNFILV